MDYSKVNNALNGWVGSGARRDRAKTELADAMQIMQAQQQVQENNYAKEKELNDWQEYIHGMASQIAVRNEDKDRIQALYDQEKETFIAELAKHNNDPVKFMNSGGRRVMTNFFNNITQSDEAKRIKSNTEQVQGFYEQLEGNKGEFAHLISNQERREFNAFMEGSIDTFKHRSLHDWEQPDDKAVGNTLADKFLQHNNNFRIFQDNYMIEYGLSPEEAMELTEDDLRPYVAQYVGGGNPMRALQRTSQEGSSVNKSVAGRIQRQHKLLGMKKIDTSVISGKSPEYVQTLRDYDMGNFTMGVTPENTDIMGHRGFVGNELTMAKAVLGKDNVDDIDKFIPDVQAISGSWYEEDGAMVAPGETMGDLRPGVIFMGYKVKQADGSYQLVKKEDLDGDAKEVEHALIQEYESDDVLWFNSYYYNEIDPEQTKVMTTYSKLLGEDGAIGKFTAEKLSDAPAQVQTKPINAQSSVSDLQQQIPNYVAPVENIMNKIGLGTKKNDTTKSILLSLAAVEGDMSLGINSLMERFSPNNAPELNQALLTGTSNDFYRLYFKYLIDMGADPVEAEKYITQVDELREKIQKAL